MDNEKMDGLSMNVESAEQEKLRSMFPQITSMYCHMQRPV